MVLNLLKGLPGRIVLWVTNPLDFVLGAGTITLVLEDIGFIPLLEVGSSVSSAYTLPVVVD